MKEKKNNFILKFIQICNSSNSSSIQTNININNPIRLWACSWCKSQFTHRNSLYKHKCIDVSLKNLRKKKEANKKKQNQMHLKRRIDLSYIETTSLTHYSQFIADNLAFYIDGTKDDLIAYSREIKHSLWTIVVFLLLFLTFYHVFFSISIIK